MKRILLFILTVFSILDPQNMGLDTVIAELCALLAEIWRNIHFPVMASLICIKMVCGTFY